MPGAVASPMGQKLPALRSGRFWPMPPRRPLMGGKMVLVALVSARPGCGVVRVGRQIAIKGDPRAGIKAGTKANVCVLLFKFRCLTEVQ